MFFAKLSMGNTTSHYYCCLSSRPLQIGLVSLLHTGLINNIFVCREKRRLRGQRQGKIKMVTDKEGLLAYSKLICLNYTTSGTMEMIVECNEHTWAGRGGRVIHNDQHFHKHTRVHFFSSSQNIKC